MQIEEDSCFIKHHPHPIMESVALMHFKDVWFNGYTVDDYTINIEGIYYENAAHNGINPAKIDAGTYIMKKQFLRWKKQIQQAKEAAVKMMRKTSTKVERDYEVGDFILFIWEDDSLEDYRNYFDYYGIKIVDIKDDNIWGQNVCISEHEFDSIDKIVRFEDIKDIQNNSYLITAEAFWETHYFVRNFCKTLFEEIKSNL